MRFYSKIICLIVVSVLFVSGCGKKPEQQNKLVVWHWLNDRKDALDQLAEKYTEQTGIEVEFKLFFPPDIYAQKVIAAARAGNLPDIFGILAEKLTIASFVQAGHIPNLLPYMNADYGRWKNSFYPQTLDVVSFQENNTYGAPAGIYGVPIDTAIMQFVYNKALFKKSGIDPDTPPTTINEFINYANVIRKDSHVYGFTCGWGESWMLNCLVTEWAINVMGEEKFLKTISGEIPYTDEEWIEVFSLFEKLRRSGILAPNVTALYNKESEDSFARGKAAFSFNGSWSVNVYRQLNPSLDYAFFPLPAVSTKHPVKVWGGGGSSFMVNAKSPRKEKAINFLKWITAQQQQKFLAKETNNLPAIRLSKEDLPEMLQTTIDDLGKSTHPNVWPHNEDSRVIEALNKGLQQVVMGIKTAQQIAKEIQEVNIRVSK
ncbi:MAG: extracellular solute-binding protein [Candidatus Omnitrophica bacterium]|nr:extracellular solute-binding protein [Candidatus Omnitrophota bacterium]